MTHQTLIDIAKPRALTDEERWQIDFLIERKTGIPNAQYLAELSEAERDVLLSDSMMDDRNRLFDQVAACSAHELILRYEHEQRELKREVKLYLQPADEEILKHWLQMDGWSPTEALCLWLGSEPRVGVELGAWAEHNFRLTPEASEVKQRWVLILRALWVGVLVEPIVPDKFIQWASSTGRTLPELLKYRQSISATLPDRPDMEAEAARLKREIERLKYKLTELNKPHYKKAIKLFGALCVGIYGYDPKKPRNAATQIITNIVSKYFETTDPRTVREYIKFAVGELHDGEKKISLLRFDGELSERKFDPA